MKYPECMVFGLDIGTRSIVGTVGYKQNENDFIVVAQSIRFHETRAMIDGQIHDIGKVAETIAEVKKELEKQIERKLSEVCIAAAGRVLKTIQVHADFELGGETVIEDEHIHSLELAAVEKAYNVLEKENVGEEGTFYCVGYTVISYHLNGNQILNLESHKGTLISADVLATFLPNEVVDGLYSAVEKAGLKVDNLTLEPIAAINIAIPEKFRLLNIALLDVGAGTSDICITKGGSICAYGMIPRAGDEITELLVQNHLVEFAEAEKIKTEASSKKRVISYKDIMGLTNKVTSAKVLEETASLVEDITGEIAGRIIELNGGRAVSAVFIVGGGGKLPAFSKTLAKHLGLQPERVALRGEEVLGTVKFLQPEIKKDPILVTPIGICLNYYEKKNNFIFVQVNGERVKLYDNGKLTVVDAALSIGFQNEKLFPRRGAAINFTLNGNKKLIRGEAGEPAQIILNGKHVSIAATVMQNDIIEIRESTMGADAVYEVGQMPEFVSKAISFMVNGKKVSCPRFVMANNKLVSEFYSIKDGDELQLLNYYTVAQLFEFIDILPEGTILVNNEEAALENKVYENFTVTFGLEVAAVAKRQPDKQQAAGVIAESFDELTEDAELMEEESFPEKEAAVSSETAESTEENQEPVTIHVTVNHTLVKLKGKARYILVDILDVYAFDFTTAHGSSVVITRNGEKADFSTSINEADLIEMYWVK